MDASILTRHFKEIIKFYLRKTSLFFHAFMDGVTLLRLRKNTSTISVPVLPLPPCKDGIGMDRDRRWDKIKLSMIHGPGKGDETVPRSFICRGSTSKIYDGWLRCCFILVISLVMRFSV